MTEIAPAPQVDGSPTDDATGSQPSAAGNSGPEPTYTKAQVEALVEDRLRRDRDKRERDTARATEAAEAARLTAQQEFKALADRHEARVRELEPQAEQAARYETALRKHLDAQRQDLPGHITELLDKLDVADQLEYLAAHRAVLSKPVAAGPAGVPGTPRAASTPSREDAVQQALTELNATRSREF